MDMVEMNIKKQYFFNFPLGSRKKILGMSIISLMLLLILPLTSAQDFIIENKTSALFIVNGTTGDIIMAPSFGLVGIGTISPYNTLTVIGSVGVSGSLNASSINTTGSAYFAVASGKVGIGKINPATGRMKMIGYIWANSIKSAKTTAFRKVGKRGVEVRAD